MKNYPLPSKISWWRLPEWLEKLTTRVEVLEDAPAPPTPVAPYKVYTALLTQSGGDDEQMINTGTLTVGVTYYIDSNSPGMDFTNVGAPNNNPTTYFVATGTTPNSWGIDEGADDILFYNTGAPVVTVLENTIGNIWFEYYNEGQYALDGSFLELVDISKIFIQVGKPNTAYANTSGYVDFFQIEGPILYIGTRDFDINNLSNGILSITPIEIRVYN